MYLWAVSAAAVTFRSLLILLHLRMYAAHSSASAAACWC